MYELSFLWEHFLFFVNCTKKLRFTHIWKKSIHLLCYGFILADSSIFHFNKLLSFIERISNKPNIYNEGKY
jgi:hypothetical protein